MIYNNNILGRLRASRKVKNKNRIATEQSSTTTMWHRRRRKRQQEQGTKEGVQGTPAGLQRSQRCHAKKSSPGQWT